MILLGDDMQKIICHFGETIRRMNMSPQLIGRPKKLDMSNILVKNPDDLLIGHFRRPGDPFWSAGARKDIIGRGGSRGGGGGSWGSGPPPPPHFGGPPNFIKRGKTSRALPGQLPGPPPPPPFRNPVSAPDRSVEL